jgi:hypothetical protein
MTIVVVTEEVAAQIRMSEGPVELIDANGRAIGLVRPSPTEDEVERARSRASRGERRLSWDELVAHVRDGASD